MISNNPEQCHSFKAYSQDCFKPKDLETLKYFLSIQVAHSSVELFLCQCKYALDILTKAGLLCAKPTSFPMEQNLELSHNVGEPLVDAYCY